MSCYFTDKMEEDSTPVTAMESATTLESISTLENDTTTTIFTNISTRNESNDDPITTSRPLGENIIVGF